MKKLINISTPKILLTCGLGLLTTMGGFWHHQVNQAHLSTIHTMNQGIGTCFGRINQSFTAMMIKDVKSPYLDKGFTQLSGACLEELKTTFKTLDGQLPKVSEALNKLNAETTWFHEKLGKIHSPMLLGQGMDSSLSPIYERYAEIEKLKVGAVDELDAGMHRLKEIQAADKVIMGSGLLLFILGLGLMSAQELRRMKQKSLAEKMAVNLIKNNQSNVGAMVDSLITKALADQGLVVSAQIFKDYHESILEGMTMKNIIDTEVEYTGATKEAKTALLVKESPEIKVSLQEVLASLQTTDLRFTTKEIAETDLKIDLETCGQILSTAMHKMMERRMEGEEIVISSEILGDRCLLHLFLANAAFNSEELEAVEKAAKLNDPYLLILSEIVKGEDITWTFENSIDKKTNLLGMEIIFNLPREPKVKNLVSVVKGKKRDIARGFVN